MDVNKIGIATVRTLVDAKMAIQGWKGNDTSYMHLYWLLGYDIVPEILSERDLRVLELLAGPDGYAIYRVLLARKDR